MNSSKFSPIKRCKDIYDCGVLAVTDVNLGPSTTRISIDQPDSTEERESIKSESQNSESLLILHFKSHRLTDWLTHIDISAPSEHRDIPTL